MVDHRRNYNIMRTPTYSLDSLRSFFKSHIIGTMKQLKAVLGTAVDMTVYRKLRQLSYHSSYSHQGQYYTLSELTRFNRLGLWQHDQARFSKYGTLIDTAHALVGLAEKGYSLSELRQLVGCDVKQTLLSLVRRKRVHRETIGGQYVYFAASAATQRKQQLARLKGQVRLGSAEGPEILAHEVRAAILLFMSLLDEKQRRLYAGLESLRIGRGGDAQIARLLDLDLHTVAKGRHQLQDRDLEIERVRRKGAGRHAIKKNSSDH
jgi:hypothetical protein